MTDAPNAVTLVRAIGDRTWRLKAPLETMSMGLVDSAEYIRADIHDAAIAAEREACAKVAEASIVPNKGFKELASNVRAERIAAAIRARKDSE